MKLVGLVAVVLLAPAMASADEPAPPPPTDPAPAPAPAKTLPAPDTSKVEALFERGTKHYDVGEWDAAIADFKQAYALMPDPSFLFNLGQSYRQKSACREATAAYKSYLRNAPDDDRSKVEQLIRDLEPCVKLEDDRARRLAPVPQLSPRHKKLRWAGIVTAGVGALVVGGGVVFTVKSIGAENDLERACVTLCEAADARALEQRGEDASRNAKRFYVAGGAMLAAGAALFFYTVVRAERVVVQPTAGGAVATTTVRF